MPEESPWMLILWLNKLSIGLSVNGDNTAITPFMGSVMPSGSVDRRDDTVTLRLKLQDKRSKCRKLAERVRELFALQKYVSLERHAVKLLDVLTVTWVKIAPVKVRMANHRLPFAIKSKVAVHVLPPKRTTGMMNEVVEVFPDKDRLALMDVHVRRKGFPEDAVRIDMDDDVGVRAPNIRLTLGYHVMQEFLTRHRQVMTQFASMLTGKGLEHFLIRVWHQYRDAVISAAKLTHRLQGITSELKIVPIRDHEELTFHNLMRNSVSVNGIARG